MMAHPADVADVVTIRPPGSIDFSLRELWRNRELAWFLALRNVKVRYKQSAIGIGWAVLQPFMTMIVFTLLFARVGGLSTNGVPAPVFYYAGLVPWFFFSTAVGQGALSLVGNAAMLQKIYFPRLVLPLAVMLSTLVDFAVAFVVLVGMMAWYGVIGSGVAIATLPLFLLLAFATALGVGMLLGALNVRYRDVQYATPFLLQIWLLATVAVPASAISQPWRTVYAANPMAGVVEGFRWALLGHTPAPTAIIGASVGVAFVLLAGGLYYFRRTEAMMADVI